jgi:hypothetical protein
VRRALLLMILVAPLAGAQDFTGTWDVVGTDPTVGAYAGAATVERAATGWRVTRLVRVARPLPDGRTLALSWHGAGQTVGNALRVDVDLRQQDFVVEHAGLRRGPQHRAPLRVSATLSGTLTTIAGRFVDAAGALVADDVWTRTGRVDPPSPGVERRLDPLPSSSPRALFMRLFQSYHTLPALQPYVSRPEFQAAVHLQRVDTTGRDYTRAHPDHLLVVQKVADDIALLEEGLRASAFRWRLHEKARGWGEEMLRDHVEASTGMLGGLETSARRHVVHGDSALHQGVWVASQAYRFQATSDPQALANVESGVRALLLMVDAPGNPDEFARAVEDASTAPANWARSTAIPGLAYLQGGNNDMLHGIEYGFVSAERVLPAGHPLLAEIGARARSLVLHCKVAQRGKHTLLLGGVATRLTGDPAVRDRYRKVMTWSPLERLWLMLGEGVPILQEVNGRSGPHLATCTFAGIRVLGGARPNLLERSWRWLADRGLGRAFAAARACRPGNLAAVAAFAGVPGAGDVARDVLTELPFPRPTGTARYDHEIDPEFCLSPYPALPWKLDWMRDPGRQQSLISYPLWELGESDNYWKEGPFAGFRGGINSMRWSSQDLLHAYWAGRAAGAITPAD